MSRAVSQRRCHASGWPYISDLVLAKLFEWPPSMAYDASVNGAPAKPISGTRPSSSRLHLADRLQHVRQRLARLERAQPIDVVGTADRALDLRPFALDEVEGQAHRLERQQQIGEEDRGVDVDAADRLQRDLGGEVGLPADLQQRIPLAKRAVLGHVAAGLAHEPDRRGVHRLAPAGLQESGVGHVVSLSGQGCSPTFRSSRASVTSSSSHSGL